MAAARYDAVTWQFINLDTGVAMTATLTREDHNLPLKQILDSRCRVVSRPSGGLRGWAGRVRWGPGHRPGDSADRPDAH